MGSFWDNGGLALHGFLIPDQRIKPSSLSTSSSYAEEGVRAGGVAAPDSSTARLVIESTGDQDEDLVYQVEHGGHPVLGDSGTAYSWRKASEAATARRGWNAPNLLTGLTAADWSTTSNTMVCALGMANGQILVAYRAGNTSTPATAYLQTYTPDTDTWSGTIAFPDDVHVTGGIALAQLPEGNVLAMYRHYAGTTGQSYWAISRYSIADAVSGGSWSTHALSNLDQVPTVASTRTRLLIQPSGEMAFFYGWSANLWQMASRSQGTAFTQVLVATPAASTQFDAVVTASGKILVVAETGGYPTSYTIASAWTPYTSVTGVTIDGATAAVTDLWLVADPAGRVYCYGRVTGSDIIYLWFTDDDGATWTEFSYRPLANSDANTAMQKGQAVHVGGSVWVVHQHTDPSDTHDNSVWLAQFGGFSNITIAASANLQQEQYRLAPGGDVAAVISGGYLLPYAIPTNWAGWTMTGAGTDTLAAGRIVFTTVANTRYAALTTVPTVAQSTCLIIERGVCSSGGSTTLHNAGFSFRWTDGATIGYEAGVYLDTTRIVVRDIIAGTTLATATPSGGISASEVDILFYMEAGTHLYVAYKRPYETKWTEIWEGGATTSTAAGTGTRYVRKGTVNASTTTHELRTLHVTLGPSERVLASSMDATYPNIIGRALTGYAAPIDERSAYGRKQTYICGKDGPGRVTDTFQATTRADYPIEAVHWQIAPSPGRGWRSSAAANVASTLIWNLVGDGSATNTSLGSSMLAMVVRGCSSRYVDLYGDTAGSMTSIASADMATGFTSLEYTRTGNVIRVDTGASTAGSRYVWANELVGAYVDLGSNKIRRISAHTEGAWNIASGRRVELILDPDDGEVPYDGSEPASGSLNIWHHSALLIVPNINTTTYRRLGITIPAGAAATDPAHRIGAAMIGRVQVVGQVWSWGWGDDYQPNARDIEVRPMSYRRRATGPVARDLTIAWPDGVPQIRLRDASPTPDFLSDNSADTIGLASKFDVPYLMAGILSEIRSGEVPVVVLPRIPTSTTTITDPTLYCHGHVISGISLEHSVGEEGVDEIYRVGSVAIREIV